MPKLIDVSATFDNCAFHAIAANLLAHQERSNELDIMDRLFKQPKGNAELVDLFEDNQAFENFFTQVRLKKEKQHPGKAQAGETFEKVLMLGIVLRSYLKQILQTNKAVQERNQERFVRLIQNAQQQANDIPMEILLPSLLDGENGVLADISKGIFSHAKFTVITKEQLINFWNKKGMQAYANRVGMLGVQVSHEDIKPLCMALRMPFQMFHLDASRPLSQGGEIGSLRLDAAEDLPLFEPLILLIKDSHYRIQLDDDNAFADDLVSDKACYDNARIECMALPLDKHAKSWAAQFITPLLFLPCVLSAADQSIPGVESLTDAVKAHLGRVEKKPKALFLPSPPTFASSPKQKQEEEEVVGLDLDPEQKNMLNQLIKDILDFMSMPIPGVNKLWALKQVCNESAYMQYVGLAHPGACSVLDQKLRALPQYKSSFAFVHLLNQVGGLDSIDEVSIKCAVYALFAEGSQEKKQAICHNLLGLADSMKGAQEPMLRYVGFALLAYTLLGVTLLLATTTGFTGVAVGIALAGALLASLVIDAGNAKGSAHAMIDFVNNISLEDVGNNGPGASL